MFLHGHLTSQNAVYWTVFDHVRGFMVPCRVWHLRALFAGQEICRVCEGVQGPVCVWRTRAVNMMASADEVCVQEVQEVGVRSSRPCMSGISEHRLLTGQCFRRVQSSWSGCCGPYLTHQNTPCWALYPRSVQVSIACDSSPA